MSQRNYSWPPSSISTASTIYSRGSWATPTLSAFANSGPKLTLITSYRRCLQKGACHEWKQGRCIKMWLLPKSPESKYRRSVFDVMYLILKLLWHTSPPPFSSFLRKSFGCPRSRREKHRCSWVINCYLPNLPSANQRESSGPVAIRWICYMTNSTSL